jgi:peptidyl-tRNA hydrolase
MALDKATLKNEIKSALLAAIGAANAEDAIATALSNAIDVFVKSGTVTVTVTTPDTINGTGTGAVT